MTVRIRCALADPDERRAAQLVELFERRPAFQVAHVIHGLDRLAPLCGMADLDVLLIEWELIAAMGPADVGALLRTAGPSRTLLLVASSVLEHGWDGHDLGVSFVGRPAAAEELEVVADYLTTQVRAIHALSRLAVEDRQLHKMEALGRLAAGVAHDFNTQLSVIFSFAETLPDGVMRAARRAAALTRQLLAFSRRQERHPEPMDLDAVAANAAAMLGRLVSGAIRLVVEPAGERCLVMADSGQMEQVITNLVVNARDAMPAGGTLTLRVTRVEKQVALSVTDTGHGMDAETLDHVFEPFFTTKPASTGTGLGLSIVYGIVQQSGGRVEVQSRPGAGTTVTVWLPAVSAPEYGPVATSASVRADDARADEIATATVLLVVPERAVRLMAAATLTRRGHSVIEAADAREALAKLEALESVDLLIADAELRAGGDDLLSRVRRRDDVRVLWLCGAEYHGDEKQAGVLLKPFTPDELIARVQRLLASRSSRRCDSDSAPVTPA